MPIHLRQEQQHHQKEQGERERERGKKKNHIHSFFPLYKNHIYPNTNRIKHKTISKQDKQEEEEDEQEQTGGDPDMEEENMKNEAKEKQERKNKNEEQQQQQQQEQHDDDDDSDSSEHVLIVSHGAALRQLYIHFHRTLGCELPQNLGPETAAKLTPNTGITQYTVR